VLSEAEIAFLNELKKGKSKLSLNYQRVLKSRILKKQMMMADQIGLINDVLEKLFKI
jgi:hypothetical protein